MDWAELPAPEKSWSIEDDLAGLTPDQRRRALAPVAGDDLDALDWTWREARGGNPSFRRRGRGASGFFSRDAVSARPGPAPNGCASRSRKAAPAASRWWRRPRPTRAT